MRPVAYSGRKGGKPVNLPQPKVMCNMRTRTSGIPPFFLQESDGQRAPSLAFVYMLLRPQASTPSTPSCGLFGGASPHILRHIEVDLEVLAKENGQLRAQGILVHSGHGEAGAS